MRLSLFDYDLPKEFIAQRPLNDRSASKMLVLEKSTGKIRHEQFYGISKYLFKNDIVVFNESKVLRCRLFGKKISTGARIECFVLRVLSGRDAIALLRPYNRIKEEDTVSLGEHRFKVKQKEGEGKAIVTFDADPYKVFERYGQVPLPPYIKKRDIEEDRYQTVFAKTPGSCAAPTAGLHFTSEVVDGLKKKGILFASIALDIGLDTFKPITEKEIERHKIHSEHFSISEESAQKINKAKKNGGRLLAVGTTTVRVLETSMHKRGAIREDSGNTDLYIYPGFKFKAVDILLTNFHLPRSSLLVMVSAFAGRRAVLASYEEAKINNYRFYSFGDCMLII
jgi:S-adenosylmethionine:tRNA ribosyltransferase-isomerase